MQVYIWVWFRIRVWDAGLGHGPTGYESERRDKVDVE